jgi:hypothetical protein
MKNIVNSKSLLLFCLLFNLTSVYATREYDSSCGANQCREQNYDCNSCGCFDIEVRAGVAPTIWSDRGLVQAVSCNALAIPGFNRSIVDLFKLPKFSKFFHVPWIVGVHLGYEVSPCFETYIEFNYRQARGRTFELIGRDAITIPNDVLNVTFTFNDKYRAFDAYIGARYYWTWDWCWCNEVDVFLGGKFGLVHRKKVDFAYNFSSASCVSETALTSACTPFFFASTRPAAGLNIGAEWCLGCGFWLVLTGEVVATCGPKNNDNIAAINAGCNVLPSILPSNLIIGHIGTEIFFPITLGLKYSF